jgi:K+-transporting ATPase ATPase A chain
MGLKDFIELFFFVLIVTLLTKPLGLYLCKVLTPSESTFLDPICKPLERLIYRVSRIDPHQEQDWLGFLRSMMAFSLVSTLFVMILLALQYYLPWNPQKLAAPSWDLNFNTAVSFMTNTNWQSYSGESTMSYFSQMAALTVQNFVSPAVGLAVAAALVRGLARKSGKTIGNFWADLVRICLYLLLPICIVISLLFVWEGVPQNFSPYIKAQTMEGGVQIIAEGPIASQEAIKMLGTNGGGFMGANSAHPYENPTPFTNLLQMILILLIPAGEIYYFGKMVQNTRHGWCLFAGLMIIFVLGVLCVGHCERVGNPFYRELGLSGGNWEGKEQRFGLFDSSLFASVTTAVSCGAVNCCHDSLTPIGGLIPMLYIQLSEVIFGGVGAGLYSVLIYVLFSIFIAGLIIGRTPEYLGNKIDAFETKMMMFAFLAFVLVVHVFTSIACYSTWGISGIGNAGPHGFSELLYAYSSCSANNGSAFAGLSANAPGYNITLGWAMVLGRFATIIAVLALAGSFVQKQRHPESSASIPIASVLFTGLIIGVILVIGALTFFPAMTLGPILEEFSMLNGVSF